MGIDALPTGARVVRPATGQTGTVRRTDGLVWIAWDDERGGAS